MERRDVRSCQAAATGPSAAHAAAAPLLCSDDERDSPGSELRRVVLAQHFCLLARHLGGARGSVRNACVVTASHATPHHHHGEHRRGRASLDIGAGGGGGAAFQFHADRRRFRRDVPHPRSAAIGASRVARDQPYRGFEPRGKGREPRGPGCGPHFASLGPRIRRGMRGCRGHLRRVGQDVHARGGCLPASVPSTSSSATHAAAANDVHNVRPPFVWLRPARHLVVHTGPPLLSAERGWRL